MFREENSSRSSYLDASCTPEASECKELEAPSDTSLNTWLEETDLSSILYLFQLRYDCDAGQYDAWLQQKEHVERVEVDGTSLQASFKNSLKADTKYWDIWAAAISKGVPDWNETPATIAKYFAHKRPLS
ncbi:hypothetical protein P9112_009547 [Eukaryota sp. TZLM1-RC]